VYSGDLRIICDTVPIGNTALNGYFSAGSFSDSRDVSQVTEGGGQPNNAFNPADLVQNSVTSKDGLKEISAMKGIVSLVGSDIQPFYSPPNADETDMINGGWRVYDTTGSFTPPPIPLVSPAIALVAMYWVSPWDTQFAPTPTFGAMLNINTGPINLNGVLDFKINMNFVSNATAQPAGCIQTVQIEFRHVFVVCGSGTAAYPFACTYTVVRDQYQRVIMPDEFGAGASFSFESNPRTFQHSFTVQTGVAKPGGMYLGTCVEGLKRIRCCGDRSDLPIRICCDTICSGSKHLPAGRAWPHSSDSLGRDV
jgi:hypothetical protein